MHALVIEDDALIALMLRGVLESVGFTSVSMAATEARAVQLAREKLPALITSDVALADGTGNAAVEAITAEADVPVVFVTGSPGTVDPVAYPFIVTKPVDEPTLLLTVRRALLGRDFPEPQSSTTRRSERSAVGEGA